MAKKKSKQQQAKKAPVVEKVVEQNTIFQPKKRNFSIGQAIQPKRDLGRFVKWPKYVRLQRQREVLKKRLKVPPSINQFTNTLSKDKATALFDLLMKYQPETKQQKKDRLKAAAEAKAADAGASQSAPPPVVKYGINHVTSLVESKKAKLVVIAHDVDPIEIVIWLPALCRWRDVPYCIVKSKSRLGAVVHKKTATALAITNVNSEDAGKLAKLIEGINSDFTERADELRKQWGGGIMGEKTNVKVERMRKAREKELAARMA
jgi:large subunit ribosomal protein L7Ae